MVMKGDNAFKNLYKLISDTIKGDMVECIKEQKVGKSFWAEIGTSANTSWAEAEDLLNLFHTK